MPCGPRRHADREVVIAISHDQLLGLDDRHVIAVESSWCLGECRLHPDAIAALGQLRADAAAAGFDLRIVSGYRSFARQAAIWNAKAAGLRPVLDEFERPIDVSSLDDATRVRAILRWSALPGASRHHWGSDMDVVDAARLESGRPLELLVADTHGDGIFAPLHRWLDERVAKGRAWGFFRPYTGSGCAVAREPWHLSHAPLAWECQHRLDASSLATACRQAHLALHETIVSMIGAILRDYVQVPAQLYAAALQDPAAVDGESVV